MKKTNFTFNAFRGLASVLTVLMMVLGVQSSMAQCPNPTGLTTLNIGQNSASLRWTSNNTPTDNCWTVTLGGVGMSLEATGCPQGGQALFNTTVCFINNVPSFSGPVTSMTVVGTQITIGVANLPPGTSLQWFVSETCDGIAPPNNVSGCTASAPFQTLDAQYTAVATSIVPPTCPFASPGYTPNGSFTVTVTNGSTCAGTYTVNASPVANSGPGGSTPPLTTVTTYIGFPQGAFFFGNAGSGTYTVTVTETGPCNPPVDPVVFQVVVPNGVDAVAPIFTVTNLIGTVLVDNDPLTPQGTALNFGNITIPEGSCSFQQNYFAFGVDNCDGFITALNAVTATAVTTPNTIIPGTQVTVTPDGFGFYQIGVNWSIGTTVLTIVGADSSGNTATLTLTATVVDNTDPVVTILGSSQFVIAECQTSVTGVITFQIDDLCDQNAVNWANFTPNFGGATAVLNFTGNNYREYFVTFPAVGNYLISGSYVDFFGNTGFMDQIVQVIASNIDAPPIIYANAGTVTIPHCQTSTSTIYSFTITDDCAPINIAQVQFNGGGSGLPNLNGAGFFFTDQVGGPNAVYFEVQGTVTAGTFFPLITYQGVTANPTITVNVAAPNLPPTIIANAYAQEISACTAAATVNFNFTILDDCEAVPVGDYVTFGAGVTVLGTFSTTVGTNARYFEYELAVTPGAWIADINYLGVNANTLITITQEANIPPIIIASSTQLTLAQCTTSGQITYNATIIDDCSAINPANIAISFNPAAGVTVGAPTVTPLGPTSANVSWPLTLSAGVRTATISYQGQSVTAVITTIGQPDLVAPVIVYPAQDIIVALDPCGPSTAIVVFEASAVDNCGVSAFTIGFSPAVSGAVILPSLGGSRVQVAAAPGTYTVVLTATDLAGNVRQEDFRIIVTQAPAPQTNLACIANVNITLDNDCERLITAEMLLSGNFGCLTNDDFVITIDGVETDIVSGCGTYQYMIQQPSTPQVTTGFTGDFAPANWTTSTPAGYANAVASVTATTITLTSPDGAFCAGGLSSTASIATVSEGTMSFNYSYTTADAGFEFFVINVNGGVITQIQATGAGTFNRAMAAGDVLLLAARSADCVFGSGTATITNFQYISVPVVITQPCWGTLLVEDKFAPTLVCDVPCSENFGFGVADGAQEFDYLQANSFNGSGSIFTYNSPPACLSFMPGVNPPNGSKLYFTVPFTVSASGSYTFNFAHVLPASCNLVLTNDAIAMVYTGAFNPAAPCANLVGGGDDGAGLMPVFTVNLTAGTQYTLVYATWGNVANPFVIPPQFAGFCINFSWNVTAGPGLVVLNDVFVETDCTIACTEIAQLTSATTLAQLRALGLTDPVASDNCDVNPITFTVGPVSSSDVCDDRFVPITYTVSDVCGNVTTCVRQVFVGRDDLGSVCGNLRNYDGLDLEAFECDEEGVFGGWRGDGRTPYSNPRPEADPTIGYAGTGSPANQSCNIQCAYTDINIPICGEFGARTARKILRRWTCVDWCLPSNQVVECTQLLKVADHNGPVITLVDADIINPNFFACEYQIRFARPEVVDACSGVVSVSISSPSFVGGPFTAPFFPAQANQFRVLPVGTHVITYTAVDGCGNVTTLERVLELRDVTPPIAVCERFRVVSLGGDCRARIYAEAFDDGSYDNCEIVRMEVARKRGNPNSPCAPNAIDSTQIFGGGFGPFVEFCCADLSNSGNRHIVFFRVVDAAGNSNVCMVEVEVQDKLPPTMVAPPDITVDCRYHFDFNDSISRANLFGTVIIGDQTRRLLPSPNPFVAARQADRCNRIQNYPGNNPGAPAVFLDGAAFDNCFPIVPANQNPQQTCALRVTESVVGDLVCRTSVNGPILRVFTVTDNFGNIARCTQQITVTNLFPFNSGENLSGIVYQGDGPNRGFYLVYRQIQAASGAYESNYGQYQFPVRGPFEGPLPTVPQFLLSTDPAPGITPLGSNGPGIDGKRRFRLRPINPAYPNGNRIDIVWPADLEVDVCGSALTPDSLAANPRLVVGARPYIYREDLCSQVGMTYDEWEFDFDAGCKKIIRRWKVIDWCQEFSVLDPWMWDQIIKVIDNEAPVITSGPLNFCFEGSCNPQTQAFPLTATATDNCANCSEIRWDWEVFPFGNRNSPIRRVDLPGESPNNAPRGCEITVNRVWPATPNNGPAHIIKWVAEDGCGNKTIREVEFRIRDCKKPTPVCFFGLSTDLMPATSEVPIQAVLWNAGSFDNCTANENLIFRAIRSGDNPDGNVPGAGNSQLVFTCDDLGTVSIQLWVGDEYGNWDFCETFINVQNNMGAPCPDDFTDIAGALLFESTNVGVEYVTVKVTTETKVYTANSNVQGNYNVLVPMYAKYTITPERNDNPVNGVSTQDISIIQRHILGNAPLTNVYKLIAADASGDGRISAADLVDIRRVILDKAPMFGVEKSWRFVPTEFEFENPANPFQGGFPESRVINPLEAPMMNEGFISIKVGDVTGNAAANSQSFNAGNNRSGVSFDFVVDEISMKKGNEYKVDFRAADIADISGFQYTMNFNVDMLDFVGFEAGKLNVTEEHFGFSRLDIGRITSSWNTNGPLDLNADDVLFTLTFRAKSNASLSEAVSINSSRIAAEAYTTEVNAINLGLVFNTGNGIVTAATYELFQNEPNPFANETKISFSLPEAMNATIRVFDVTGKVVRLIEGDFAKGLNNVIVKKSELPNAGVLYYQLEAGDFKATKKMVIID